jgi:ABC-type polysaccharide/polyol phosphate transport system ATPase subunit
MAETAIRVENLSKLYKIGAQQQQDTLRDAFMEGFKKLAGRKNREGDENLLWALREVSFEIEQGEAVGIIGRNGAGKSTLLKILSQITEPTSGRAVINGRVGSLLEVGTGFHPELTGRENISLYGAILGMRREEIQGKFDEIVAFAEIERFLDTPVKRYSSGMYVRLAFAVAAHLEPEILLVDEVLAVGDIEFQRKCLGKMGDVAEQGRTVLFVSHNMNVIQRLCPRTILLKNGKIDSIGETAAVITNYLASGSGIEKPNTWIPLVRPRTAPTGQAFFTEYWFSSGSESSAGHPYPDSPLEIRLKIYSDAPRQINSLAVTFYDQYGTKLVNVDSVALGNSIFLAKGSNEVHFHIDELHLNVGIYAVGLWMANLPGQVFERTEQAFTLEVVDLDHKRFGRRPVADGLVTGSFRIEKVN